MNSHRHSRNDLHYGMSQTTEADQPMSLVNRTSRLKVILVTVLVVVT
jgi:hypothetical protein